MFEKVLIANRGEIALRIHRACREMGIQTVAVHSTADADAMHVRLADEAVCIGPASARESYLNIPAILTAATITGADAIHPGIGFMSENAQFAQMVEEHGFTFIGPTPEHIRIMGDKVTAKKTVLDLGLPVVPGSPGPVETLEEAVAVAEHTGYPVLIKAAAGGGGKGMKVAWSADQLREAYQLARGESRAALATIRSIWSATFPSRAISRSSCWATCTATPSILANAIARSSAATRKWWRRLHPPPSMPNSGNSSAVWLPVPRRIWAIVASAPWSSCSKTVNSIFIEMNTRLQVEHTITEMITGIDLVREQIRVATGAPLGYKQSDIRFHGHAIECRVNAEHPETFIPSPGKIDGYHAPASWAFG